MKSWKYLLLAAFLSLCPYIPRRHPLDCGSSYFSFLVLMSCCFLKSFLLLSLAYLFLLKSLCYLLFIQWKRELKYCCSYNKGAFRAVVELLHLSCNQTSWLLIMTFSVKNLTCCQKPNLDVPSAPLEPGTSLPLAFWLPRVPHRSPQQQPQPPSDPSPPGSSPHRLRTQNAPASPAVAAAAPRAEGGGAAPPRGGGSGRVMKTRR